MDAPEFRTVFAGVRPARLAVLVDQDDQDWQDTCRRIIECLASTWGGKYSIIVPTDGSRIDAIFWEVLEAFDPDYICEYHRTGLDLKIASAPRYEDLLQGHLRQAPADQATQEDLRESLDQALSGAPFPTVGIMPELKQELTTRLAPFFLEDHLIEYTFSARSEPDYPLTKLSVILPNCEHSDRLFVTDANIEAVPPLWIDSVLGATYQEQTERIQACGVTIEHVRLGLEDVYPLMVAQLAGNDRDSPDYFARGPFEFGMAALSQYRSLLERTWEMPAVVVVGLTLRDLPSTSISRECVQVSPGSCPLGWTRSKRLPYGNKMTVNVYRPQNYTQAGSRVPFSTP